MRAVMLMFDSLNRRMLEPYGCDWVRTPNFRRLAERTATFDTSYVGSMPCMPARRELHTGRYNFLHRSWGPLEPFDDSMPELLKRRGIHTRLVTDHYHYWEDGGCTYHPRYSSHEFFRGQEGDPWKADLATPIPASRNNEGRPADWMKNDWMNRRHIRRERDWPQARTFASGLEFLESNRAQDNWFLTIETFDPHEPYFAPGKYRRLYPHGYRGPHFDWPRYGRVTETPAEVEHLRLESAALHSMCDTWLGRFLDTMDRLDLWRDTLLIVNTDHGFLLGEHDWWAKCCQPFYNEVAHTPLFVWDPRCGQRGVRRRSLVQTIDLAPTLLDFFGAPIPPDMQGRPLRDTVAADAPVRTAGLFGLFGGHVNITDGRFVYMRAPAQPDNAPLHEYTLMPTHMRGPFAVADFADMQSVPPFGFTKGCRLMRLPARPWVKAHEFGHLLFDLAVDPAQQRPLQDPVVEQRLVRELARLLHESEAPPEQFTRLGVPADVT